MRPILLLVLAGRCAGLAPHLVPCVDVLTRAAAAQSVRSRPDVHEVTSALAELSNAGAHPESWAATLESGAGGLWKPVFSATPSALKAARRPDPLENVTGRYLSVPGGQSFRWSAAGAAAEGEFENTVKLLGGAIALSFSGSFSLAGRRMTLLFRFLTVRLLWLLRLPRLDIREGRGVRGLIERVRGGAKTAKGSGFRKRPSVYAWCYADRNICIAQGSSGSVALWGRS